MCASYGLGGGPYSEGEIDFEPFSEKENALLLHEWMRGQGGNARITGKNARNLNPIIRDIDGRRTLELAWWSLPRPSKGTAFNARDDSLLRYWKVPFQRRGLLPASWYVEKGAKFGLSNASPFGIAAITSTMIDEVTGREIVNYSMVTRNAVGEAATVHDRMPLVLPIGLHDEWLDPARPGDAELVKIVRDGSEEISAEMTVEG